MTASLVVVVLLTAASPARAGDVPAPGADDGMGLLRRAAESARQVSFEGVRVATTRGAADTGGRPVDVVHRAGEATGYRYAEGEGPGGGAVIGQTPLLVKADKLLLEELAANYRVTRAGASHVDGRSCAMLEMRRADGSAAGRLCIDDGTGLPLRKEVRDLSGHIIHATELVELDVGGDPGPLPTSRASAHPWSDELSAAELDRLREQGWRIPERPAWNLRLIRAWAKDTDGGRRVHLAYSDGLSVVSVFAQRGRLAPESKGTGAGAAVVVERDGNGSAGQRIWDSGGFVYTTMGQAPPGLVDAAARGFPMAEDAEFWARVYRGFGHLIAAVTD